MAGSIPPPDLPEVTSCSRALHALGVLKLSLGEGNPKKKMPHLEGGVLLKKRDGNNTQPKKKKGWLWKRGVFFWLFIGTCWCTCLFLRGCVMYIQIH